MAEEPKPKPKPKVEIVLSAASPLSVKDAAALPSALRDLILAAAGRIAEADKAAADKADANKHKAEQHEQSFEGRVERKKKASA